MATKQSIFAAIEILRSANQRSKHVRNAIDHLRREYRTAPYDAITWWNFHDATSAVWSRVELERLPQREADFISASGSRYWKTAIGVYRLADHWGMGIRSCNWWLAPAGDTHDTLAVGFCLWQDFKPSEGLHRDYRSVCAARTSHQMAIALSALIDEQRGYIEKKQQTRAAYVAQGAMRGWLEACDRDIRFAQERIASFQAALPQEAA